MSKQLFLAIRIPNNGKISSYLSEYQSQFGFNNMRWVDENNLHLTLKFFGKTDSITCQKIIKTLDLCLIHQAKFTISIIKLSIFGSKSAPKVLWWGIKQEDLLIHLVSKLQLEFDKIDLYTDRQNFVPHISLARIVKINSKKFFHKQLARYSVVDPIEINIESIVLLESKPTNKNPIYLQVAEYKLV